MNESDRMWIFPMDAKVDVVLPDGTHRYWSTHCRHDHHAMCSAKWLTGPTVMDGVTAAIVRRPASCKHCQAPCACPCHTAVSGG